MSFSQTFAFLKKFHNKVVRRGVLYREGVNCLVFTNIQSGI